MGAAVAAWMTHAVTEAAIWLAVAELGAFINLFNLIPIWQLDGESGPGHLRSAITFSGLILVLSLLARSVG